MRPVLKPALRLRWRDDSTLQLGSHPDVAIVVAGLGAGERALLSLLDGHRTLDEVVTAAVASGTPRARVLHLLSTLEQAGALDDGAPADPLGDLPLLERERLAAEAAALSVRVRRPGAAADILAVRRRAVVAVHGGGSLAVNVAALLAAAGIGTLAVPDAPGAGAGRRVAPADLTPAGPLAADVERTWPEATRLAVRRATRSTTVTAASRRPDLAVLAAPADGLVLRSRLYAEAVPHLAVETVDDVGIVGPLVLPGGAPCLGCLDLHRADRDPGWTRSAAFTSRPGGAGRAASALVTATAGLAALSALAYLDELGDPARERFRSIPVVAGTLELRGRDGWLRRRSWSAHPDCRCAAGVESAAGAGVSGGEAKMDT